MFFPIPQYGEGSGKRQLNNLGQESKNSKRGFNFHFTLLHFTLYFMNLCSNISQDINNDIIAYVHKHYTISTLPLRDHRIIENGCLGGGNVWSFFLCFNVVKS